MEEFDYDEEEMREFILDKLRAFESRLRDDIQNYVISMYQTELLMERMCESRLYNLVPPVKK